MGQGVIDTIGGISSVGSGAGRIYEGIAGQPMGNGAKMALTGAAALAGLNMVPGVGLVTSGLTKLGGGLVKKAFGSVIGGAKNIASSVSKGGNSIKSLAQSYH